MDVCWMAARWDKGGKDYINCPMDKAQYDAFVAALNAGEKTEFKEWEKDTPYFEGCMPIEVMAERGPETLRYGPMKAVGLDNPQRTPDPGRWPYAVVQLRQDNKLGTLWNMVGFQTKLKHGEQVRIFRTIPGLEKAEFARLGGIHRNSFIKSPAAARPPAAPEVEAQHPLRRPDHRLRRLCRKRRDRPPRRALRGRRSARRDARPAAARNRARRAARTTSPATPMPTSYQPMNVNFGLMPAARRARGRRKADRKKLYTDRARAAFTDWLLSAASGIEPAA